MRTLKLGHVEAMAANRTNNDSYQDIATIHADAMPVTMHWWGCDTNPPGVAVVVVVVVVVVMVVVVVVPTAPLLPPSMVAMKVSCSS
jgi:hypothetical protein